MAAAVSREKVSQEHALYLRDGAPFAGKYAVERILGQGGMGTVFEARHLRLGHRVAIKVLGSELRDYPELVTRFEREARAAGALSSRHAVRVFDIDMTEDATPFIVMELLGGCDLARILEREGPQPVRRAVRWVIEACDAIAEAHRLGIIHRDIKPSNLFLSDDGVKVLDFGIAKRVASKEASITHAVAPLGTPQYMSPEQVRCAKDVDVRTDVWSVGVTLYELVTGRTPFAHESPSACIASIAADPVPDPRAFRADLPAALVDVLLRALRKDPAERFASIDALVEALAPFAEGDAHGHPASAVHEVVATAALNLRRDESTLDGEDLDSVLASGMRPTVHADTTVPPAVSRAPMPVRSRRTSSLAIATAALLGLVALVVTPKCVGTTDGDATAKASEPATARPAPSPAPAVLEVPTLTVAPTEAAVEPAPVATPAVTAAVAAPPKKARPTPAAKPRSEATTIVRHYPSDNSPVHGGLSNPGF